MTVDESAHLPRLVSRGPRPTEVPHRVEHDLARRDRAARVDDERADAYDVEARFADAAAGARDLAAVERDVDAETEMSVGPLTTSDYRGRRDREAAARDRTCAVDDRARARRDRTTAKQGRNRASGDRSVAAEGVSYLRDLLDEAEDNAEDMLVVGQAQGKLMQQRGFGAAEALIAVAARAAQDHLALKHAALSIVTDDGD
jgi:hypothetical protein